MAELMLLLFWSIGLLAIGLGLDYLYRDRYKD